MLAVDQAEAVNGAPVVHRRVSGKDRIQLGGRRSGALEARGVGHHHESHQVPLVLVGDEARRRRPKEMHEGVDQSRRHNESDGHTLDHEHHGIAERQGESVNRGIGEWARG